MSKNSLRKQLSNFISGLYTKKEAEKVFDAVKDADNFMLIDKFMSEIWDDSKDVTSSLKEEQTQSRKEAAELLHQINGTPPRYQLFRKMITVAASIAILFSFAFGGYMLFTKNTLDSVEFVEVSTSYGEIKNITLPDNTNVSLNSCTRIIYPSKFVEEDRKITLIGQAYFQVAKDKDHPFIIETDQFKVKVLGTSFDVKAYTNDQMLLVSVESGKVQVDIPEARLNLIANEQIEINSETNEFAKQKDDHQIAVWRTGNLRFNKMPIKDVAKELERAYNCRIEFKPGQEFDNLITGEHNNKNLESVLTSIEYTSGIHSKSNDNNKTILLYK